MYQTVKEEEEDDEYNKTARLLYTTLEEVVNDERQTDYIPGITPRSAFSSALSRPFHPARPNILSRKLPRIDDVEPRRRRDGMDGWMDGPKWKVAVATT